LNPSKEKHDMSIEKDLEELKALAVEKGAILAEVIPAHEVILDERALYKCQFGCPAYGRYLTCPPHTPPPSEFERALRNYKWAMVLEGSRAAMNRLVVEIETEAMRLGYLLALGLIGQYCLLCEECVPPGEPCRDPANARPCMAGLGINVFATLDQAGIGHEPGMGGGDDASWGMVLVD
jgi:predicted metal-binding protein